MLRCQKCGTENPPGRLFCGGCGGKLDMAAIAGGAQRREQQRLWIKRGVRVAILGVLLWLGVCVALALWPRQGRIGAEGTRLGGRRVERQLQSSAALGAGQSVSVTLTEADVNGYIDHFARPELDVESLSVAFHPRYAVVRIGKTYGPYRFGPFVISPRGSVEVSYVPIGAVPSARKVVLGHLPLPGPLRSAAARRVARLLAGPVAAVVRDRPSGLTIDTGQIEVAFKK